MRKDEEESQKIRKDEEDEKGRGMMRKDDQG